MNSIPFKNQILFVIYFTLSGLFTWWFIMSAPFYVSKGQQVLSFGIAAGKWGINIVLAYLFLGKQRWIFIKNIGYVCFIGSSLLLPFTILSRLGITNDILLFTGSLMSAIVAMIYYYYQAVRLSIVPLSWWYIWLLCLLAAICLQLTIVFHVL
jgi:hypothetical protein